MFYDDDMILYVQDVAVSSSLPLCLMFSIHKRDFFKFCMGDAYFMGVCVHKRDLVVNFQHDSLKKDCTANTVANKDLLCGTERVVE